MILQAVIYILYGYWIYRKAHSSIPILLVAMATAAYCIAVWDLTSFPNKENVLALHRVTAYFTYVLLVLMLVSVLILTKGGFLKQKKQNRPELISIAIFLLSPLWIISTMLVPSLPVQGLEWTAVGLVIYMGILGIQGQDSFLEPGQPIDVSPSMRIANSGVQLLNHSFKNKLLTIEIALRTMRSKEEISNHFQKELYLIEQSVEHLKQMVQRLREKTKAVVLQEKTVNLESLLSTIQAELSPLLPPGLLIELQGKLNAVILCDPVHLKEVIHNILRNSMEAIGKNGGKIRVYLHPPIPHNWLTLCIQDNGPGIPFNSLSRVFEPYFTTKAGSTNYGLGLSYCYNVMRASACSIKLNSSTGNGTTVILSFPPKKVLVYPEFK